MNDLITMTEAAERMKCSRQWIHYLITNDRLKAQKIGGIYILRAKDVDACDVRPRLKPEKNGHTPQAKKKRTSGKTAPAKRRSRSRS